MAVNMRRIAELSGCSMATVSMALRGIGRISPETQARIRKIAAENGYEVSPLLSKAFTLVRRPEQTRYRETVALIVEYPMDGPHYQKSIYDHAVRRGESLGFKVDAFHLSGRPSDHRRLSRILVARGIRGLIILPRVSYKFPRLHMDWAKFVAVELGQTLWEPRGMHRVERAVYHELIESFHLLKKAGYKRIGMAVEPKEDEKRQGVYTAACFVAQQRLPARQVIPPLTNFGQWRSKTFHTWFKKFRPDVVIVNDLEAVPGWITGMGLSIPGDVSIFCSNVKESRMSGLSTNLALYGERAVEMLSILLERNELGFAAEPYYWLVRDLWKNGETLRLPLAFPSGSDGRVS